ncbi:MAG TPA: DUF4170 domain-containing protein, partial [Ilumatobacteraceae bacterium]|nr:DUF4170 domain-containing protein [Ilumatobacteraceae bacterium]
RPGGDTLHGAFSESPRGEGRPDLFRRGWHKLKQGPAYRQRCDGHEAAQVGGVVALARGALDQLLAFGNRHMAARGIERRGRRLAVEFVGAFADYESARMAWKAAAQRTVDNGTYASLGEALFNLDMNSGAYSCARCHTTGWSYGDPGESGAGALGPNLTAGATITRFPLESDMIAFVKSGSELGKKYGLQSQGSGKMPGFGSMLTDEQIKLIVEYVRGL